MPRRRRDTPRSGGRPTRRLPLPGRLSLSIRLPRPTRLPALLAALAAFLLAGTVLAAPPAGASPDPGQKWVADSMKEQLARKPGGVVSGNTITYAKEDVTLTYQPAVAPGGVVPNDYAGCASGKVCLYTTSSVVSSGIRLTTGSLWCPWENTNDLLDLRNYGLAGQIHAADSESGWWAEGIWSRLGVRGEQWKMAPYGILSNLSATNLTYLNVCINQNDLEY
ncbi:MAG: hypothetical protein HOV83_13080 [Catenulispora sp.]|nr:hypothetical protein [Catenulispora sp.]